MFSKKNKKQKEVLTDKKANFNFSKQGNNASQSAGLKTSTIVVVVLVAILSSAMITGSVMYYFMTAQKTAVNNGKTRSVSYTSYNDRGATSDAQPEEIKSETINEYPELFKKSIKRVKYENNTINKGEVKWQQPEDLGDLGLASEKMYRGCFEECNKKGITSGGIKYYKVGKITDGNFRGKDIIVIKSSLSRGKSPNVGMNIRNALVDDKSVTFILDERAGWNTDWINDVFIEGEMERNIANLTIEELDYPDKFEWKDKNNKTVIFIRNKYDKAFFTSDKLRLAFTHQKYGQVFTTDAKLIGENTPTKFKLNHILHYNNKTRIVEEAYVNIFGSNGFYIEAPDGKAVSYKMDFSIFDKIGETHGILQAIWEGGQKNNTKYGLNCGEYACDKTGKIKKSDLVVVGRINQGGEIYGYKSTAHPDFQKFHKDEYWATGGEEKKNPEDFLKMRPQIFWEDPFGRLLVFTRQDIVSPAEMGKPVIYLYPEKETEVSVQVEPVGGISISEPKYGAGEINGWQVLADTKSNLKNKANGKTYPYLFWEGYGNEDYEIPKKGFVIASTELDKFLNEKLSQLGMIEKEINDFKEFWIPEMAKVNKPYYFITFLSKEKIDKMAPLIVEPKPDSVIRVLMDYKGLAEYRNIEELKIETPERKGFVVVEWGGML